MNVQTTAYILGDNISTDQIHPPRYFSLDMEFMMQGFMRGISDAWSENIVPGSIIIAGDNFGCGSSRELTAQVFRERGISLVLATSFARIFYRNLINLGVPACHLETPCPWAPEAVQEVVHDADARTITAGSETVRYQAPSPFVQRIIAAGGVIPLIDVLFESADE